MKRMHLVYDRNIFKRLSQARTVIEINDVIQDMREVREFKRLFGEKMRANFERAFSGEVFPGMTGPIHSDRLIAALGPVQLTRNAVIVPIADRGESLKSLRQIETGSEELDLKPFLLRSPKARQRKPEKGDAGAGGPYVIVPLGHDLNSSGTFTQRVNARLDAYEAATKQQPISGASRNRRYKNPTSGQPHKSPLARNIKVTGLSGMTFRTVSSNSAEDSWIIPVKAANPVREAVVQATMQEMGLT